MVVLKPGTWGCGLLIPGSGFLWLWRKADIREHPMEDVETFEPGELVIKEGTKGTSAFIILSGAVEVLKKSGQRDIPVATLGEGQVFGEMGLIEDRPRSATVKAMTGLKLRVISREGFNELLKKKPSVLIPIIKSLFERLRQASEMLAEQSAAGETKEQAFEVILEGQTVEAQRALGNCKRTISKFPFLVGRDSKNTDMDVFYNNDLFLPEKEPYVVSRNHVAVHNERGAVWVIDRGSAFGTIVNGKEIGHRTGTMRARLDRRENQVIIGPATSKFIFLLNVVPR
jgi:CRP/FNR family cyclic AMP-dependent transcriptional regulator